MINFTVGPVQSEEIIHRIGAMDVPYFRTPEFSEIMLENEHLMKELCGLEEDGRVVFITGSGTASMEAAVFNAFTARDKVLVVNGGSFGQRFVDLCQIHEIPYEEISVPMGKQLTKEALQPYENQGFTGFLVNLHETSTGVLYDAELIHDFCARNNCFLIVDAISAFLAEKINMQELNIDMMITGSQKALACPPGISIIMLSSRAVERVYSNHVRSLYFDLKSCLKNGERGQTPYTPAVGILLQINARLKKIMENGGLDAEQEKIHALAEDFRSRIKDLPLDFFSEAPANAVTTLAVRNCSAFEIFQILKDEYQIWICPNGGETKETLFRVGHIGALSIDDNTKLIDALHDLHKRNILK